MPATGICTSDWRPAKIVSQYHLQKKYLSEHIWSSVVEKEDETGLSMTAISWEMAVDSRGWEQQGSGLAPAMC